MRGGEFNQKGTRTRPGADRLYSFPNAAVDLTMFPSAVFQTQVLTLPPDWIFCTGGVIQVRCPLDLLEGDSEGETAPEARSNARAAAALPQGIA